MRNAYGLTAKVGSGSRYVFGSGSWPALIKFNQGPHTVAFRFSAIGAVSGNVKTPENLLTRVSALGVKKLRNVEFSQELCRKSLDLRAEFV